MKKLILAVLLLSVICSHSQVVTEKNPPNLDFIKGDWKGTGWMMTQQGKTNSVVTEHAECRVDCSVYVFQGTGKKYDSVSKTDIIVHDAFGVIAYDKVKAKWVLRAFKKETMTESELTFINDKKFSWSMTVPGGMVRFTTDYSSGKWVEIGEFSRDNGTTWMQIMWMSLDKQ